jgi:hypothetical protein
MRLWIFFWLKGMVQPNLGKVEVLKLFIFVVQKIINHAEYCYNNLP